MKIATTIDIDAPPEAVWTVLMDFPRYPDWNPFILSVEGPAEVGARLRCVSWSKIGDGYRFEPTVEVCEGPREFTWRGNLIADAAFTGRHRFLLTAAPSGRTKFEHSEEFTGFLTPILARLGMFKAIAGMYERMNEALKIRVEQLAELAQ